MENNLVKIRSYTYKTSFGIEAEFPSGLVFGENGTTYIFKEDKKLIFSKIQKTKQYKKCNLIFKNGKVCIKTVKADVVSDFIKFSGTYKIQTEDDNTGFITAESKNVKIGEDNSVLIKKHDDEAPITEVEPWITTSEQNVNGWVDHSLQAATKKVEQEYIKKVNKLENDILLKDKEIETLKLELKAKATVITPELKKVQDELDFQKKYNEELEKDTVKLKEDIEYYRGLLKDAPGIEKSKMRNLCIEYMRKLIDDMEYTEAHAINDLISAIF